MIKKYLPGDVVGPYHHKMIERYDNGKALWECGECHNPNIHFICSIAEVARKKRTRRSCGCIPSRFTSEWNYKRYKEHPELLKEKSEHFKRVRAKNTPYQIGTKWGRLTVVGKDLSRPSTNRGIYYLLQCDCGNPELVSLLGSDIRKKEDFLLCCPECKKKTDQSNGEQKVQKVLEKINKRFVLEKTFNNCINPKTNQELRFDFYLPEDNCCIEYDGEQHYHSIDYFGGEKGYKNQKYKDEIKNQYCKEHNIKLIRIPYYDYDKINENYLQEKIIGK